MRPRVTLASVLSSRSVPRRPTDGPPRGNNVSSRKSKKSRNRSGNSSGVRPLGAETEKKSILSRLLSKCTVIEPTYDEVGHVPSLRRVDEQERRRSAARVSGGGGGDYSGHPLFS